LIELNREKCSLRGWKEKHSIPGKVPLKVDHINGNTEENSEPNLSLICPNSHVLNLTFRNINTGKDRAWRTMQKIKA
jgi:hypothetical protein